MTGSFHARAKQNCVSFTAERYIFTVILHGKCNAGFSSNLRFHRSIIVKKKKSVFLARLSKATVTFPREETDSLHINIEINAHLHRRIWTIPHFCRKFQLLPGTRLVFDLLSLYLYLNLSLAQGFVK